jgi:hypothetical protein
MEGCYSCYVRGSDANRLISATTINDSLSAVKSASTLFQAFLLVSSFLCTSLCPTGQPASNGVRCWFGECLYGGEKRV